MPTAGIAGAGLAGRMLAWQLLQRGWAVTLFDADSREARNSCAYTGAGMLAPYCELETAEPIIAELGARSLQLWPEIIDSLPGSVFYQQSGSLVVSHPRDHGALADFATRVRRALPDPSHVCDVRNRELRTLEPELADQVNHGLFFPSEGQVDNRELLQALADGLAGVKWHSESRVPELQPGQILGQNFDWVFDCRGLGAREHFSELRGVRGELVHVIAPDVSIERPIRVMHPRYPLYVVPRRDHRFVIGATSVECDDAGPITVRGTLELLSAAYAIHPGFAEARLIDTSVNCRPAFPDNLPRLDVSDGIARLNGLYRHGFLLTPALIEQLLAQVT
jgi:glycine oxidase